jgi:hypothetical protein
MFRNVFVMPARGSVRLVCVWLATGDAANPLICHWMMQPEEPAGRGEAEVFETLEPALCA